MEILFTDLGSFSLSINEEIIQGGIAVDLKDKVAFTWVDIRLLNSRVKS